MTPEAAIRAAFAGPDQHHRAVKIALLKVLHAGLWAETQIDFTSNWIARMIEDPPYSIWYGPDTAHTLAGSLRTLADELERAVVALNSAKPHWNSFFDSAKEARDDIGIRSDRQHDPTEPAEQPPF